MKTKFFAWIAAAVVSISAWAGGGVVGGATEFTQILNNVQLLESYARQGMQYIEEANTAAAMAKNLLANPLGVALPDVMRLANNTAKLMSFGQDIASSISRVDQNFASTFKNPTAQSFATKFSLWTNSSQDALKTAMLNAGLQREQFADDTSALQSLTDNLASSQGNLAALQALGSLNARQVQESMKLRDLISQQQVAQNTYLAAQAAKEQVVQDAQTNAWSITDRPIPTPRGQAPGRF